VVESRRTHFSAAMKREGKGEGEGGVTLSTFPHVRGKEEKANLFTTSNLTARQSA